MYTKESQNSFCAADMPSPANAQLCEVCHFHMEAFIKEGAVTAEHVKRIFVALPDNHCGLSKEEPLPRDQAAASTSEVRWNAT